MRLLQPRILVHDILKLSFEFVDFLHALVLDSEVFQLQLHISNLSLQLILLLNRSDQLIKIAFQRMHFLVDRSGHLVLLSIFKHDLFKLSVNFLNFLSRLLSFLLDLGDFTNDLLDFSVLSFQRPDDLGDALGELVAMHVLRHGFPLLFHELNHLLFVFYLLNNLFYFSFEFFYLVGFVLVLDSLV